MSLSRLLAYPFVAFMALGVAALSVVLVWSVAFDGKAGDLKGILGALGFITWWSWAGVSVYVRYIKKPREEQQRRKVEAQALIEKSITAGSSLSAAINTLRETLAFTLEPRHRPSTDQSFDTVVEIETHGLIILLFSRGGIVQSWNVR